MSIETIEDRSTAADPSCAVLKLGGAELRLEVVDGCLEITTDLDVRICSKRSVEFIGEESVRLMSGGSMLELSPHSTTLSCDNLSVQALNTNYEGDRLNVRANAVRVVCGKLERVARTVIERAQQTYLRIESLLHVRAGRIRSESEGSHWLQAENMRLNATRDVRVQGKSINLG